MVKSYKVISARIYINALVNSALGRFMPPKQMIPTQFTIRLQFGLTITVESRLVWFIHRGYSLNTFVNYVTLAISGVDTATFKRRGSGTQWNKATGTACSWHWVSEWLFNMLSCTA